MRRIFSLLFVVAIMAVVAPADLFGAERPSLESTCWTDAASGDWIIGLFPDGAVFDSRVWDYGEADFEAGRFRLVSPDGRESVAVKVGKEADGVRKFRIGRSKPLALRRLDGTRNNAYPSADSSFGLMDTRFVSGDSVLIRGWLRNVPARFLAISGDISASWTDLVLDDVVVVSSPIDSLGRFELRIPAPNTRNICLDRNRMRFRFPVEPGQTYFLLVDFPSDLRLWMGRRSRLQNELMAQDFHQWPSDIYESEPDSLLSCLTKWYSTVSADIDAVAAANPTLSPLWAEYVRAEHAAILSFYVGQARFKFPYYRIPDELAEFGRTVCWPSIPANPGECNPEMTSAFIRDCLEFTSDRVPSRLRFLDNKNPMNSVYKDIPYPLFGEMRECADSVRAEINAYVLSGNCDSIAPFVGRSRAIAKRIDDYIAAQPDPQAASDLSRLFALSNVLDTLGASVVLRDICVARDLVHEMSLKNLPLPDGTRQSLDSLISTPYFREIVVATDDRIRAIAEMAYALGTDSIPGMVLHCGSLDGASTGEEILARLIEPYRGHFVLIDIWGTWCGPCKAALRMFADEREALDPYGVVYMFLANSSPEDSWRSVITEYDVIGQGVAHYNLPEAQQTALENYLGVHSYPTYRLVAPDGTLLDVTVDPRNISSLVALLESLTVPSP